MGNNSNHNIPIGTVINDKYVILEFIARGGMGEVYRAHQTNLKRDVAIKIISREWLESLEDNEEELHTGLQRFRNEVRAMAQIRHPNILQIYDYGSFSLIGEDESSAVEYISMEYVPGGTLRSTMSEDGFYPEEELTREWLVQYFLPVLDGVQALHDANIIHRDLKPGNVLMDGKIPKITDFGLARSSMLTPVTRSTDMKGTPAYMSPEHFMDLRRADHRADIYSLGKILFEAVDGKISPGMIPFKQAGLKNPETPFFQTLNRIIRETTAEERNNRMESVRGLRSALLEAIDRKSAGMKVSPFRREGPFTNNNRWLWTGVVVAVFSVIAMTVWHLTGEPWWKKAPSRVEQPVLRAGKEPPAPAPEAGKSRPRESARPKTVLGMDGITMRFIPGGVIKAGTNGGTETDRGVQVSPFYMDETRVSIHHFVEFLNSVKEDLMVEGGLVRRDKEIWLLLGDGNDPQDQILYRHERFLLIDPEHAARPVVRVTWYGASAYAGYYGERLPTEYERELSIRAEKAAEKVLADRKSAAPETAGEKTVSGDSESVHMMHMQSGNHVNGGNSGAAIRPEEADDTIKEWVVAVRDRQGKDGQESGNYSSLVVGSTRMKGGSPAHVVTKSFRYPWEGFFDVGFRCVAAITIARNDV